DIYDKLISHYYGDNKDNNSISSYMWYSTGNDDCDDNDYLL
ncbi:5525_t:CDS:1, partial [Racocetra persica]